MAARYGLQDYGDEFVPMRFVKETRVTEDNTPPPSSSSPKSWLSQQEALPFVPLYDDLPPPEKAIGKDSMMQAPQRPSHATQPSEVHVLSSASSSSSDDDEDVRITFVVSPAIVDASNQPNKEEKKNKKIETKTNRARPYPKQPTSTKLRKRDSDKGPTRQKNEERKSYTLNTLSPDENEAFRAAQEGDVLTLVRILQDSSSSIDINQKDFYSCSLLMVAACGGHQEAVALLLDRGCDPLSCDSQGHDAESLAFMAGHPEVSFQIQSWLQHQKAQSNLSGADSDILFKGDGEEHPQDLQEGVPERKTCPVCNLEFMDEVEHLQSIVHNIAAQKPNIQRGFGLSSQNVGYQLLLRSGWSGETGLGKNEQGRLFPIQTKLKNNRLGIGVPPKKLEGAQRREGSDVSYAQSFKNDEELDGSAKLPKPMASSSQPIKKMKF